MPTVDKGCTSHCRACDCREERSQIDAIAILNARDLLAEEPIPGLAKAFLERAAGLMEEMGYGK